MARKTKATKVSLADEAAELLQLVREAHTNDKDPYRVVQVLDEARRQALYDDVAKPLTFNRHPIADLSPEAQKVMDRLLSATLGGH